MPLFHASGPQEFVAVDTLAPLHRISKSNQYVIVINNRYSKFTRAIRSRITTITHVANLMFELWIIAYGFPTHILTANGVQIKCKLFATFCTMLGVEHLTTTAYLALSNMQVKTYNRLILIRLGHNGAKNQEDWDEFVQPLTYANNTDIHNSTRTSPSSLVLNRHPHETITVRRPGAITRDTYVETSLGPHRLSFQRKIDALQKQVNVQTREEHAQHKRNYDAKSTAQT